jgi:ABC-type dipeptide/oligopeptide/nickel transport system permease subunit
MRIVDILFGLPSILLVVLLAVAVDGFLERRGADLSPVARQAINIATLLVAIGGVSWLTMARVIRGQVLSLKAKPFMEACRAIGVSPARQFVAHLLPNLIGPITVYAALAVPAAILSESFLSFLGIGVREPLPSWGNLAAEGLGELNTVQSRWWLLAAPCAAIALTLVSLNFLGDELRERFDPMRGRRVA